MNKILKIKLTSVAVLVFLTIVLFLPRPAGAASFDAGRIIDNSVFTNKGSMSIGDIQNFLNSKVPNCRAGFTCLRDYVDNGKSAAQIIWEQSQNYSINPQVILVTLQKENVLITDTYPYPLQYRTAMGFACPDREPCDAQWFGFTNQVTQAARHFRNFYDLNPAWSIPHRPGLNFIKWAPLNRSTKQDTCGGGNVVIQNRATAALYSYTPYQPNSAALNNLYGEGDDCSAYGNRNFWRNFSNWFGSTLNSSYTIIKSTSSPAQYVYEGGKKRIISTPEAKIAWDIQDQDIIEYTQSQIDSIPYRDTKPLTNLARVDGSQAVYLVDGGNKYYIPSLESMNAWKLDTNSIVDVGVGIGSSPSNYGSLGYSVRSYDPSDQRIFMVDGGSLRPYSSPDILKAWEGETPVSISPSVSLFNSLGPVGTIISSTKINNSNQDYLVVAGQKLASNSALSSLYPGPTTNISNATTQRLVSSAPASWFIRASNDATVYMIDNGTRHAVQSPGHLTAWSPRGVQNVNIVTSSNINTIPLGSPVTQYVANQSGQYYFFTGQKLPVPANLTSDYANSALGSFSASTALMSLYQDGPQASGFLRGVSTPTVYLLDGSTRRSVTDWDTFVLLNGNRNESTTLVYDFSLSQFSQSSSIGAGVSTNNNNYVFDNGTYYKVDTEAHQNWGFNGYIPINSTTLSRFTDGGLLSSNARLGNTFYLMRNGRSFSTTNTAIADIWAMNSAQTHSNTLIKAIPAGGILQPFFASSNPLDLRIFLKDSNMAYILSSPAQVYNYGYINSLLPKLSPAEIANYNNGQYSANNIFYGSNYYVVDSGKKRSPINIETQTAWNITSPGNFMSTSVSLANFLQTATSTTILIKGSAQNVYVMEDGKKRWITSPQVLAQSYQGIPITQVSGNLIQLIETGLPY